MERLPIDDAENPPSHLAVRLDEPDEPLSEPLAVLYLHGFGSRQAGTKADFFRRRFLDLGLAFCSFDFQGHGESGGSLFDLSLTRNLSDTGRVHGVLAARGYRRIVLMGSSMGGGTALWYAALHPEEIETAIHIAPSVELDEGLLRYVGPEDAARWEREGKILFKSELIDAEIGWHLIEDLRSFRAERLKRLYRTPTLVFQGQKDTSVPWRKVLDFVTDCDLAAIAFHLMTDADHRMIDRLDHLWDLVRGHLVFRQLVPESRAAGSDP